MPKNSKKMRKMRPKGSQKCSKMVPKSTPEPPFSDFRETLIFNDSTMVFHGFSLPEGVRKGPKIDKNTVPQIIRKKIWIFLVFFCFFTILGLPAGPVFCYFGDQMGGGKLSPSPLEDVCVFLDGRGASRAKKVAKRSPKGVQKCSKSFKKKEKVLEFLGKTVYFVKIKFLRFGLFRPRLFESFFKNPSFYHQLLP